MAISSREHNMHWWVGGGEGALVGGWFSITLLVRIVLADVLFHSLSVMLPLHYECLSLS